MTKYRIVRDKSGDWFLQYKVQRKERIPITNDLVWFTFDTCMTERAAKRAIKKDIKDRKYEPEIIEVFDE